MYRFLEGRESRNTGRTLGVSWRHSLFVLVSVSLVFAFVEVAAYSSLKLIQWKHPDRFHPDWDDYALAATDEELSHYNIHYFDADLGWVYRPGFHAKRTDTAAREWSFSIDDLGARTNPYEPFWPGVTVAVYGDSFAKGEEVGDGQAWPALLTRDFGWQVHNYGVGGYGPGQALMRYERHLAANRMPDIAILSIFENDLSRVVLRYWSFYKSQQTRSFFKPRFVQNEDGNLIIMPPALREPVRDRAHLRRVIDASRAGDGWHGRRTAIRFPFILSALRHGARLLLPADMDWEIPATVNLLHAIAGRFVEVSREAEVRPIVLFIPAVSRWRNGDRSVQYRNIAGRIARDFEISVIDVADAEFDADRFSVRPYEGHASPYGNQVIAQAVGAALGVQP